MRTRSNGRDGPAMSVAFVLGTFALAGCLPGAYVYDSRRMAITAVGTAPIRRRRRATTALQATSRIRSTLGQRGRRRGPCTPITIIGVTTARAGPGP